MGDWQAELTRRRFAAICGAAAASAASASPTALLAQQAPQGKPAVVVEDPTLMLVRDSKVQKELELAPEQVAAIRTATDFVDPTYFLLRDLSPADRTAKAKPLIDRVRMALQAKLNRKQLERFGQIVNQAQGHRALLRDEVARTMQFTNSQRKQFLEIAGETEGEKKKIAEKARQGGKRESLQKEVTELMKDEQKQFVSLLSNPQKQRISSVFGSTFQRSQNQLPHFKPPKMPMDGPWINSEPLSLERLKGKVVALHFYAFA